MVAVYKDNSAGGEQKDLGFKVSLSFIQESAFRKKKKKRKERKKRNIFGM